MRITTGGTKEIKDSGLVAPLTAEEAKVIDDAYERARTRIAKEKEGYTNPVEPLKKGGILKRIVDLLSG